MRLATLRSESGTVAVRIDGDRCVEIDGAADVGALLADADWRRRAEEADGRVHDRSTLAPFAWAPVIPNPSKIVCVGLNYRNHIQEMGRPLPEYPTLFAKYPEALVGPYDPIVLPAHAASQVDWEAELAIVIGTRVRRANLEEAAAAIVGYSVINDVTMRDFQYRTTEWTQGKTFEATAPFGPELVTVDEFELGATMTCRVDGEVVQHVATDDLVFGPAALVSYVSAILPLAPGDVIASGTPGGVGHARKPPRYLSPGAIMETSIEGIGTLRNEIVAEG